jgi:hypothetical protein
MVEGEQPNERGAPGEREPPERGSMPDDALELPAVAPPEGLGPHVRRYGLLLALIVSAAAIEGIAEPGPWEYMLVTALLGATLVLALEVAHARSWVVRGAAVLVAALFAATLIKSLVGSLDVRAFRIANAVVVSLAPPAIILGVVRRLRATRAVTVDAVIGVICVYVLLGMFYAFLFGALDHAGRGPFFTAGATATVPHCIYYSFTTLFTVGYGDFTAASNLGRTLSMSEALLGQIYLVTVVSLIVGNLGRRRVQPAVVARGNPAGPGASSG